eukprot:TRINITY_DN66490_c3_g12_i1.p2 TRINITY_DN66490_c3_g12~~TRINITY_DN66490_c3_g12_i1.p2  ORF type:complete len:197 (-),score=94.89 TRINITY_DN66490_c3_g12_i1:73-615(-)
MIEDAKEMWRTLRSMGVRQLVHQTLNLALIVFSAIMIWKGLIVASRSESPVVVVLSGSMEPGFSRGDILFLWRGEEPFSVGEVVVFKVKGRDIPIVHRILEVHRDEHGKAKLLTKGDNNIVNDRGLYNVGQMWLEEEDVLGRARLFLPHVGMVTIVLTDYPVLKYLLVGVMGLFVLTAKE